MTLTIPPPAGDQAVPKDHDDRPGVLRAAFLAFGSAVAAIVSIVGLSGGVADEPTIRLAIGVVGGLTTLVLAVAAIYVRAHR